VRQSLRDLAEAACGTANLMPAVTTAVRAYATVGEITETLAAVFGRHEASTVV